MNDKNITSGKRYKNNYLFDSLKKKTTTLAISKKDGRLIDIKDVPSSGIQHEYKCVCCGGDVMSKHKKSIDNGKSDHWAHYNTNTEVNKGKYLQNLIYKGESIIHERAKELISQLSRIHIPRITNLSYLRDYSDSFFDLDGVSHFDNSLNLSNTIELHINSSETETYLGVYTPDILLEVENINDDFIYPYFDLAIEIYKTHKVSLPKGQKYKNNELYCIEIDLSDLYGETACEEFDLDTEILNALKERKRYKYIHLSEIIHDCDYYLNAAKAKASQDALAANIKIVDKRETIIGWALDEKNNFTNIQNANPNNRYRCICCRENLFIHDNKKHFTHKTYIGLCPIFGQGKISDYIYQQNVFISRLFELYKNKSIYLSNDKSYPFQAKETINKGAKNFIVFYNEALNISIELFVNFSKKDKPKHTDYIDLSNFKYYSGFGLRNETFPIFFQSATTINLRNKIDALNHQERLNRAARQLETERFNKYKYFFDEDGKVTKLSDSRNKYHCLFCKTPLNNLQHTTISNCLIFDANADVEREYYCTIKYEMFDNYFVNIKGSDISINIKEYISNIDDIYLDFYKEEDIEENITITLIDFERDDGKIKLKFSFQDQTINFNIDLSEPFSYFKRSENTIYLKKDEFKCIVFSGNITPLAYFFDTGVIKFSDAFSKQMSNFISDKLNILYGTKIKYKKEVEKLFEEEDLKQRKLKQQKEEENLRQQKIEQADRARKRSEELKLEIQKRSQEIEEEKQKKKEQEKYIKEQLTKEKKKLELIDKKKKPDNIKNKLAKLIGRDVASIKYESGCDKKFKMEYFIVDEYLFLNYDYYEITLVINYSKEFAYIYRLGLDKEVGKKYNELFNKTEKIIVLHEKELLLDNICFDNLKLFPTELFKEIPTHKELLLELYKGKI